MSSTGYAKVLAAVDPDPDPERKWMKYRVLAVILALGLSMAACSSSGSDGYYGETGQEDCSGYGYMVDGC